MQRGQPLLARQLLWSAAEQMVWDRPLLGWGLDSLFGTKPWLTLVMLFLGFGVGIRNVVRISKTPSGQSPGAGL